MNILFVTFYYPPEVGAPQRRISEYAAALSKRGHRVSILTGFPNYPRGELIEPYRRRLYLRENLNGIEVLRVFHFLGSRNGKWGRAVAEGSFALSASMAALLETPPDTVIVESPSLLSGWVGLLLKRMRGSSFVLHLSDLIPEMAVAVGMLAPGRLSRLLYRMARLFYREADGIVAITRGVAEALLREGVVTEKIKVIPNGIAEEFLKADDSSGTNGVFRVVYAGNHGRVYNLRTVLQAARRLPPGQFEFEFIGDGIDRPGLEEEARNLAHVKFSDGLPVDRLFERLFRANAMVIPLAGNPVLEMTVPSKMVDAMAAGLPVVLAGRKGELVEIVRESNSGIVVEPDNPEALLEAFQFLHENPGEACAKGRRGQEFVRATRLRSRLTDQLEKMLVEIVARKQGNG
jgi:glycosyltransferase involved in cell wall biosynthesis